MKWSNHSLAQSSRHLRAISAFSERGPGSDTRRFRKERIRQQSLQRSKNLRFGTKSRTCFEGPFGEVIRATGPMTKANPFRFSTQYQDDETDLLMYPNRPYSASQGRFLRKDSLQEQGGMNVYAFVANNPLSSIDILGLWNANVHNIMTRDWARANHYPPDAAKAIGNADNAVDGGVLGVGKGWGPWGDQSYHFNRSLGGGDDSRLRHNTEHLAKAEAACNVATDDPKEAAYQLGTALHPLQDQCHPTGNMLKTLDFIGVSQMRPSFECHTPSHRTPKRRKRLISESFHEFSVGWFCCRTGWHTETISSNGKVRSRQFIMLLLCRTTYRWA